MLKVNLAHRAILVYIKSLHVCHFINILLWNICYCNLEMEEINYLHMYLYSLAKLANHVTNLATHLTNL
jgi:hypothetical protein